MVNLTLNNSVDLPDSFTGKQAVFTSSILDLTKPAASDSTTVALLNHSGDTVLALGVRRYADAIVLSTKKAGSSSWDTDLTFPSLVRAFGPDTSRAIVTIKDADDKFVVSCNGNFLCTFTKRYEGTAMKASYDISSTGQDSAFSNPITVEIKA